MENVMMVVDRLQEAPMYLHHYMCLKEDWDLLGPTSPSWPYT